MLRLQSDSPTDRLIVHLFSDLHFQQVFYRSHSDFAAASATSALYHIVLCCRELQFHLEAAQGFQVQGVRQVLKQQG